MVFSFESFISDNALYRPDVAMLHYTLENPVLVLQGPYVQLFGTSVGTRLFRLASSIDGSSHEGPHLAAAPLAERSTDQGLGFHRLYGR